MSDQKPPTPEQAEAIRALTAATYMNEAKLKEFDAACLVGNRQRIEHARVGVAESVDHLLDTKLRLFATYGSKITG